MQQIKGLDLLAGSCYKKQVVYAAKNGYAIGLFAVAFKNAYKVADAALNAGCKLIRIQLLWSDTHQFGDKDIPTIKKLAAQYNKLANKYPHADVRLSTFCEHNISNPDKYLDITQLAAPNCTIVNTPWRGGLSKKYINEVHGTHSKPSGRYMYSFDGTDAVNSDVEGYLNKHKSAEVFFMWTSRFNLRWAEKDKASRPQRVKERKQRKPSNEFIDSIAYLFTDKGTYDLDKKTLLKSHAERHSASDRKGDKLLFITPQKVKELVLKRNGKTIGKIPYYGRFEDGRHRYYSNKFGFTFGCEVDVYAGTAKIGTVNCGFRSSPFR